MSKKISPSELAQIVVGLLTRPDILGELDSPESHQAFMLDIGRVVGEHCGGQVYGIVGEIDKPYLSDENSSPMLCVEPDESLPDLHQNVWCYFDVDADWESDRLSTIATPKTIEECDAMNFALRHLLLREDHSLIRQLQKTTQLLNGILENASSDEDANMDDCLEVFGEYRWIAVEGTDGERFDWLLRRGKAGRMSKMELREFIEMVDGEGEKHVYYDIQIGSKVVNQNKMLLKKFIFM